MALVAEVWTRPGSATFERVIAGLPVVSCTGTIRLTNGAGSGVATLPADFARLGDIIERDPTDPASDVRTIVRIFDTDDMTTPVHEWFVDSMTDDLSSGTVVITGADLASLMDQATVEASDWNGSPYHVSTFPDWIWGGRNILTNGDFADGGIEATVYEITSDATGGTFTLSDGTDTTAALDWDAAGITVENELETFAAITDIDVSRTPESGPPTGDTITWRITYVTPPIRTADLTINPASLTGGTATMANLDAGIRLANPWSKSQGADRQSNPKFHGTYNSPGISVVDSSVVTPPTGADYSARVFAASQFAGIQQVVDVTPGGLYQASIWVRSGSTSDAFRFIIRDIYENPIAGYPSTTGAFVVSAANTWEQIVIPDVRIPEGVSQIVFRLSYVGEGAPSSSPFGVALAELNEGAAPATIGEILQVLLDDATVDHAGDAFVWWEDDANPGTTYLDYSSFDATTDSNGDTWDHAALEWTVTRGQTYQRVLDQFAAKLGYEWEVVADPSDPSSGIYSLRVYNPEGLGTDHSTDDHPAINLGQGTAAGPVTKRHVGANRMMVEGDGGGIGRFISSPSTGAIGMIGGYLGDRGLAGKDTINEVAAQRVAAALLAGLSVEVTQVEGQWSTPLRDFGIGDRVNVTIPGVIPRSDHRVVSITYTMQTDGPDRFGVQFSSEQFGSVAPSGGTQVSGGGVPVGTGRRSGGTNTTRRDGGIDVIAGSVRPLAGVSAREFAPVAEAARRYLTEFRGLRMPDTGGQGVPLGSGVIPWLVAASNTVPDAQAVAGYVCTGSTDQVEIAACLYAFGVAWLAPGSYHLDVGPDPDDVAVLMPNQSHIVGLNFLHAGIGPSEFRPVEIYLWNSGGTAARRSGFQMTSGEMISNVHIKAESNIMCIRGGGSGPGAVDRCNLYSASGVALWVDAGSAGLFRVTNSLVRAPQNTAIFSQADRLVVTDNLIQARDYAVYLSAPVA